MPSRRVVVSGATGALGRSLIAILDAEGADLLCTSRSPLDRPRPPPAVVGDLLGLPWPDLVRGREVFFHLAAHVHRPAGPAEGPEHRRINAEATARIARACREAGTTLVFASTVAVLGRGADGAGDDVPADPASDYGRSKWLAEDAIREEGRAGLRHVILRFPLLYGPHGRGNMERMLRAIRRRRFWPIGDQKVRKSCLYFGDAARALLLAAEAPAAWGLAWIVAPPAPVELGALHEAAYRALGRKPPRVPFPGGIARLGAGAADALLRLAGRPGRVGAAISALTAPAWYDGSGFARATGFRPVVSLDDGLRRTAEWLGGPGGGA